MTINIVDVTNGKVTKVDQDIALFEGGLNNFSASWSKDSKWLAYPKTLDNRNKALFVFDTDEKKPHQLTSGFFNDSRPAFDTEGKYLYYATNRDFNPIYSQFDNTWIYTNATKLAALPLTKDVVSPLAAKNDTVAITLEKDKEEKEDAEKDDEDKKDKDDKDEDEDDAVSIDFNDIESRVVILPIKGGNFGRLASAEGKLIYVKYSNAGSGEFNSGIHFFDFKEEEEKAIIQGAGDYEISADKKSLGVMSSSGAIAIVGVAPDQNFEKPINTENVVARINPKEEWKQIFNDVWRLERDFFYDKDMHGVDWSAMKNKYGKLIDQCVSRYDVNFVIGELIGELNASHTYRGGGDNENPSFKNTGYLGVDWGKKNGQFYIKRIVKGAVWDTDVRSPLTEAGVNVNEGDYILAVNGIPMNEYKDPWVALEGQAGQTVELTVNADPNMENSRTVLIKPLSSETRLRNLEWIENNRKYVDKMSNGKVGYIYVPSTGVGDGQYDLVRMFYGQSHKEGLIIDERFNNGGQIPDRFVELLNRKPLAYFKVRDGKDWQWPPVGHFGAKAMLINGWSGSGGDAFPDYFRKAGLGPLIGTRTWGGLIGISGAPSLIDGGTVTVPTFRMYDPDGSWFKEGHGVDPDIEVLEDPESLAKGKDVQLERAVKEVMASLNKNPYIHPERPSKENRAK
jgi:tricorn protease